MTPILAPLTQERAYPVGLQARTRSIRSVLLVLGWILAALGASYVLIAHRAHALEWLPFALLLACPLMHIFMHGRHEHHHQGRSRSSEG